MQKKQPTKAQIIKEAQKAVAQAEAQAVAAQFWGQLYIGVVKTCWEKMTGEKLPNGLVDYIMAACDDAVRQAGGKAEGIKFDGLVIAAYESYMDKRPDRLVAAPEAPSAIVTPAEAREEALAGEPLVVLK